MKRKIEPEQAFQKYLSVIPLFLAIILFYAWLASSGIGNRGGTTTYYYTYLAEGFFEGNLHLSIQPDPKLLALDNPYDPSARKELERNGIVTPIDFSLYKGKFYLYWGPVPALLLASIQLVSHQKPLGDFFLAFIFGVGIFLTQSFLLLAVWQRYFYALPRWMLHISILLAGLTWPVALLRHGNDHARIYEAAIAGGQFFLISGLLVAFTAISRHPISNWRLLSAGLLWALAIGSRHTLVVPVGFLTIITTFWLIKTNTDLATKTINLISLGLPLFLGGVGLGWYNWARFGSITETGFSYQLAGVELQEHYAELFSGSYIIQNLYNYLINPPGFTSTFPFVSMLKGSKDLILLLYGDSKFYYAEPVTGLLYIFPFGVFAIFLPITLLSEFFTANLDKSLFEDTNHRFLTWIILSLSGSSFVAFLLLTLFFWAGMRYVGDFVPLMTVLSAIMFWHGYQYLTDKPQKYLYILSGTALASVSIFISTLLAISTVQG